MKVVQIMILIILFVAGPQAMAQQTASAVGEVVFAVGGTQVQVGAEKAVAIKSGASVFVGQTLFTSVGSHLHLRMRDGAFLSLRPDSIMTIAQYSVDASVPSNNRIRLEVRKGGVRSVTGNAGHANKAGFRLNTPVAAIGIRGTDFTVFTDNQISSVSVREGGVVVSPFTSACSRTALGACGGVQSVMLSAYNQQMVAEVMQQQASLIKKENATIVPDDIKPAHPAEDNSLHSVKETSTNTTGSVSAATPASEQKSSTTKNTASLESVSDGAVTGKTDTKTASTDLAKTVTVTNSSSLISASSASQQGNNSDAAVSVAPLMPITADVGPKSSVTSELASRIIAENETGYTLKEIDSVVANNAIKQPITPLVPAQEVVPTHEQVFYWGRWNAYAENADQAILRDPVRNKQIFTNNAVHVLATKEKIQGVMPAASLPPSGVMDFAMDKGEAVVMVAEKLRSAEISNPKLTINFDTSRFNTSLDVNSTALTNGTAHLNAEGALGKSSGLLASSLSGSNMNVSGAISNNGTQAGYVFEQPATGISGATSWQVQP